MGSRFDLIKAGSILVLEYQFIYLLKFTKFNLKGFYLFSKEVLFQKSSPKTNKQLLFIRMVEDVSFTFFRVSHKIAPIRPGTKFIGHQPLDIGQAPPDLKV